MKSDLMLSLEANDIVIDDASAAYIVKSFCPTLDQDGATVIRKRADYIGATVVDDDNRPSGEVGAVLAKVTADVMDRWKERRAQRRRSKAAKDTQALNAHGSKLHPDAQDALHRPLDEFMDDKDENDEFDKLLRKGATPMNAWNNITKKAASGETITQQDIHAEFLERAADLRKAEPKLTEAAAYAKVYTDPANSKLVALYKMAPNVVPFKAPIAKRASTGAYAEL